MQKETYVRDGKTFTRIDKRKARIKYNDGKTIYLIPDMMRLDNAWQHPCPIDNKSGVDFDARVNEFSYYNCDTERGRGVKYFVEDAEN